MTDKVFSDHKKGSNKGSSGARTSFVTESICTIHYTKFNLML